MNDLNDSLAWPVLQFIQDKVFNVCKVIGDSMQPTINPILPGNEKVFINKMVNYNDIQRGDVVCLNSPSKRQI